MAKTTFALLLASALVSAVVAQTAPQYGQCGGQGWTGPTACPSGWTCTFSNQWYSQCLQGGPTTTQPTTTLPPPTTIAPPPPPTTTPPVTTPTTAPPTTTLGTGTVPVPTGIPTLVAGWNFIRAVTAPNFHKYLQSEVYATPGDAVLGESVTAGQFKITNGQLVQSQSAGDLYAIVEKPASTSVNKLKVSWSRTPDTLGNFRFSGDTVEWSSSTVSRPQTNAWLVCPDAAGHKDVYINLGSYGYMTPAGCNDHTIHGFTGTTPD